MSIIDVNSLAGRRVGLMIINSGSGEECLCKTAAFHHHESLMSLTGGSNMALI